MFFELNLKKLLCRTERLRIHTQNCLTKEVGKGGVGWGDKSNQVVRDPKSSSLSKLLFIDLSFVTEAHYAKQKGVCFFFLNFFCFLRKCRSDSCPYSWMMSGLKEAIYSQFCGNCDLCGWASVDNQTIFFPSSFGSNSGITKASLAPRRTQRWIDIPPITVEAHRWYSTDLKNEATDPGPQFLP